MNGRSTKSFIQEERLLHAEQLLAPGDYFLIQFGHNDQKTDPERGTTPKEHQENLAQFIAVAQKASKSSFTDFYHSLEVPSA